MRRVFACLLCLALLSGCGFLRETTYVDVSPHDEDYGVNTDSNVLTVTSYLSLKNAILSMVEDGSDEGEIRAETYSGDLSEDLSRAVYEVTQMTPLGAYAVANMTYDYSRIVTHDEIHINIVFKRSPEEIRNVRSVTDVDGLRDQLQAAMETYDTHLVLRVGDYDPIDIAAEVAQLYLKHPDYVLEKPEATMELYPQSGASRIADIRLTYLHTPEELQEARRELEERIVELTALYARSGSLITNLRLLFNRLGRDTAVEQVDADDRSMTNSAYGALVEGRATDYGFAQAYALLAEQCGVPCKIITGQLRGADHHWCQVELEGQPFYVDPSQALGKYAAWFFLMDNETLTALGYDRWNEGDYPASVLPGMLRPPLG